MSIRTMTAVWDSGKYEGGALLVLLAMADYADEQHICHPSIGALARKARLSDRQVVRILNAFKADGVVTPIGAKKSMHGRAVTIYRIEVEALKGDIHVTLSPPKGDMDVTLSPPKGDMVSPYSPPKGDMVSPYSPPKGDMVSPYSPPKGDICADKVTSMSYDPSLDPSLDPIEEYGAVAPPAAAADVPATSKTLVDQPPIAIYRDAFLRTPSKAQMSWLMAQEITDLRRWLEVCQLWIGKGWSPTNLSGMVDLYRNPARLAELRTYRGANHETTTTRRAATNTRTTSGAGGVLAARQGGANRAGANGYHGATASYAPPTTFLIETDDDGAGDDL